MKTELPEHVTILGNANGYRVTTRTMTEEEALLLAAHLVVMLDHSPNSNRFLDKLHAVRDEAKNGGSDG